MPSNIPVVPANEDPVIVAPEIFGLVKVELVRVPFVVILVAVLDIDLPVESPVAPICLDRKSRVTKSLVLLTGELPIYEGSIFLIIELTVSVRFVSVFVDIALDADDIELVDEFTED